LSNGDDDEEVPTGGNPEPVFEGLSGNDNYIG